MRKYVEELSETDFPPSALLRLGRNTYYWSSTTKVLTMTRESPDSYWRWSHRDDMKKESAREVWVKVNGEVPEGKLIVHLDGDGDNNDLSNLAVMTRSEMRIWQTRKDQGLE